MKVNDLKIKDGTTIRNYGQWIFIQESFNFGGWWRKSTRGNRGISRRADVVFYRVSVAAG